jgi:hypothetical protein
MKNAFITYTRKEIVELLYSKSPIEVATLLNVNIYALQRWRKTLTPEINKEITSKNRKVAAFKRFAKGEIIEGEKGPRVLSENDYLTSLHEENENCIEKFKKDFQERKRQIAFQDLKDEYY